MKESKSIKTAKHLLVRLTLFMMIFTSAFVYSRSADAAGLVNRKHKTKVDRQLTLKERREKNKEKYREIRARSKAGKTQSNSDVSSPDSQEIPSPKQ